MLIKLNDSLQPGPGGSHAGGHFGGTQQGGEISDTQSGSGAGEGKPKGVHHLTHGPFLGADMLPGIEEWHEAAMFLKDLHLAILNRDEIRQVI